MTLEKPCKLHPNKPHRDGYVYLFGPNTFAHRVAWIENFGPIPDGHVVRHRCDVRACIEPTHLILGTQQDNMDDMVARGRSTRTFPESSAQEARARYAAGGVTYKELAEEYGVSISTIYGHITGKTKRPGRKKAKVAWKDRKHWRDRGREEMRALASVSKREEKE